MAALMDAAQGLFFQCCQAAFHVARGRVPLPHVMAHKADSIFIIMYNLVNALADPLILPPLCQYVFRADEFSCLRQDGCAPDFRHTVADLADKHIGGKAGSGV